MIKRAYCSIFSTSNVKNSKSYAKESANTVFASFDETTGMFADEVLLHVGTQYRRRTAQNNPVGFALGKMLDLMMLRQCQ